MAYQRALVALVLFQVVQDCQAAGKPCKGHDKSGKNEIPLHQVCREEDGVAMEYATSRCFKEHDYTCEKAFLESCTPNYDPEGNAIKGQEESCPDHFNCTADHTWLQNVPKDAKICIPIDPMPGFLPDKCKTNFDCGYKGSQGQWTTCEGGTCRHILN